MDLSDLTILVAEDEELNRIYIREELEDTNAKLIFAENGLQAVQKVKENQDIDFIIMDIKMPVMNGIEALKLIKEINPDIPQLALTAYAMENEKNKLLDEGFDHYLSKPVTKEELSSVICKSIVSLNNCTT